jgi:hypothetical protein
LRRVLGKTSVDTAAERSLATRTMRTITGLAAWATLTGAALTVRAWHAFRPARRAPFRIREIRRPRGAELEERSLPVGALRDRPNDVVSRGR